MISLIVALSDGSMVEAGMFGAGKPDINGNWQREDSTWV